MRLNLPEQWCLNLAERYSTYQIDNHFARFQLRYAIDKVESDSCMEYFRKARKIINSQVGDGKSHYSYRVAVLYKPFYEKFATKLTCENIKEINRAAKFLLNKIQNEPQKRFGKYAESCQSAMDYIVFESDQSIKKYEEQQKG